MNNIFIISKETKKQLIPLGRKGLKFINGGNWVQLSNYGANRLKKEHPKVFIRIEGMGLGESQLTLDDNYTISG